MADTNIKLYLDQIIFDRNSLRNTALKFQLDQKIEGLNSESKLTDIAAAFATVPVYTAAVDTEFEVGEGASKNIVPGYYPNGVVVTGSDASGNYTLASVNTDSIITPTKAAQQFNAEDFDAYGFKDFTVAAIPENYQDTSVIDPDSEAAKDMVLVGKQFFNSTIGMQTGSMPNNANWSDTVGVGEESITVPKGYHDGTGTVSIVSDANNKFVPKVAEQTYTAETGKVFTSVTVEAIPAQFEDASLVSLTDADGKWLITGQSAIGKKALEDGSVEAVIVEGTMANLGDVSKVLNVADNTATIAEGYVSGGTITVDVEEREVGPLAPGAEALVVEGTDGKFLSKVTVKALDGSYVSVADATQNVNSEAVLTGNTVYAQDADGKPVKVIGSAANLGDVSATLNVANAEKVITKGYTSGGTISVETTEVTVPFSNVLTGTAVTSDKFITKVNVEQLPADYVSVKEASADVNAAEVLAGNTVYARDAANNPVMVVGTMADHSGEADLTIDPLTSERELIPAGYYDGTTGFKLTEDLANMLASI